MNAVTVANAVNRITLITPTTAATVTTRLNVSHAAIPLLLLLGSRSCRNDRIELSTPIASTIAYSATTATSRTINPESEYTNENFSVDHGSMRLTVSRARRPPLRWPDAPTVSGRCALTGRGGDTAAVGGRGATGGPGTRGGLAAGLGACAGV